MFNNNSISNLIKKYGIKPSKHFGQNFLVNSLVINKIINASDVVGENIIEIGPGLGTLTCALLAQAKSVTSYEIDKKMHVVLENEIQNANFSLVKEDFLKAHLNWRGKRKLVANIPYNITTDIIFKLIKNIDKFKSATLMVQKEFGERMIAIPKTKAYGKLSVTLQSIGDIKKIVLVKNTNFLPSPRVDSIVIKIDFKGTYDEKYFNFILKCFAQKRKTLLNNLKKFLGKEQAQVVWDQTDFQVNTRPQELSVEEFRKLWSHVK